MPEKFDKAAYYAAKDAEMERMNQAVQRCCRLIQRDLEDRKADIAGVVRAPGGGIAEGRKPGPRRTLPDGYAAMAVALWDGWTAEEREGIRCVEGVCICERHRWFVIDGDSRKLDAPYTFWIIDPAPRGIGFWATTPADMIVVHPLAVWNKAYSAERDVPEAEEQEPPPAPEGGAA